MGSKSYGRTRSGMFRAGLYRMRVRSCTASYGGMHLAKIRLALESANLVHACKCAVVEIDWRDPAEKACGSQIFALAGHHIDDEVDAEYACRGMVGREFYVEVTRDLRIHIQQLATTHRMTVPMASGDGRISDEGLRAEGDSVFQVWPRPCSCRGGR